MKNAKKIITGLILFSIVFYACTKEPEIQFSFPFTLTKNHEEIATINYLEATEVEINPEQIVDGNLYKYNYVVTEGEGYLRNMAGTQIVESTVHTADDLDMNFEFIGTAIGDAEISFTVTDLEGLTETINLRYTVIHNPLSGAQIPQITMW